MIFFVNFIRLNLNIPPMKNLFYFLIISFYGLTSYSQDVAENIPNDSLISIKEPYHFDQNYLADDDLPWHARRFKVNAGIFFR